VTTLPCDSIATFDHDFELVHVSDIVDGLAGLGMYRHSTGKMYVGVWCGDDDVEHSDSWLAVPVLEHELLNEVVPVMWGEREGVLVTVYWDEGERTRSDPVVVSRRDDTWTYTRAA
jgi:hypothetical protein